MSNYITYNPYITSTKKGGVSAVFLSKKPQNFHISNTSQAAVKEYVYHGLGLYSFTGKERDSETGFSYFGARYYDSDLMTGWLSVDPMADDFLYISPYNYCNWNPVKLKDPDGEAPWVIVGILVGATLDASMAMIEGKSGKEILAAAAKGAVSGAIATTGAGLIAKCTSKVIASKAVGDIVADAISNTVVSTVFEEVEYAKNNSIDAKHIATTASKHLASSVVAGVIAGKEAKKLKTIADKRYSSENFQESISKEIKKEFRNQGKVMGNSTRKQFNIEVNNRIRNSKKATNSMIELRKNITNSTTEKITNKGIEKFIDR